MVSELEVRNKFRNLHNDHRVNKYKKSDGTIWYDFSYFFLKECDNNYDYLEWNGLFYQIIYDVKLSDKVCILLNNLIEKYYPS